METQCIQEQMVFQQLGRREVIGRFDGGTISSDAGAVLLREVEKQCGILKRVAGCFRDYRDPERIEHSVEELIKQRVYAIALGYEDLNDHDSLRHDVVMGVLCEKSDPSGSHRARQRDRGKTIAGKSTLNRLELTPEGANENSRYKKTVAEGEQIDDVMVDICIESQVQAPAEVVLDVDATDDPLYGKQEGRFFMGITRRIVIYRCTFFGGSIYCVHGWEWRAKTRPAQWSRSWSESSRSCARDGRK
jgi:hypothetical protein